MWLRMRWSYIREHFHRCRKFYCTAPLKALLEALRGFGWSPEHHLPLDGYRILFYFIFYYFTPVSPVPGTSWELHKYLRGDEGQSCPSGFHPPRNSRVDLQSRHSTSKEDHSLPSRLSYSVYKFAAKWGFCFALFDQGLFMWSNPFLLPLIIRGWFSAYFVNKLKSKSFHVLCWVLKIQRWLREHPGLKELHLNTKFLRWSQPTGCKIKMQALEIPPRAGSREKGTMNSAPAVLSEYVLIHVCRFLFLCISNIF